MFTAKSLGQTPRPRRAKTNAKDQHHPTRTTHLAQNRFVVHHVSSDSVNDSVAKTRGKPSNPVGKQNHQLVQIVITEPATGNQPDQPSAKITAGAMAHPSSKSLEPTERSYQPFSSNQQPAQLAKAKPRRCRRTSYPPWANRDKPPAKRSLTRRAHHQPTNNASQQTRANQPWRRKEPTGRAQPKEELESVTGMTKPRNQR